MKAIDDTGHDKSLEKKLHFFQKADEMVKTLLESLKKNKAPEVIDHCNLYYNMLG